MKTIPKKNYMILVVIIIITVLVTFYMRNWYIMTKEYNSDNSPMLNSISEINQDEISNYVLENPKFILYTSSGINKEIRGFESKFKNYVLDKNMKDYMIYINTATADLDNLKTILENYTSENNNINLNDNVNMYIFENGKIVKTIENANKLNNKTIEKTFKKYGVLDA
ncbi:MAG: hypothetical protein IKG40_01680 [Bacilli bacterium]|nr:hypothetical protein [Bacilli bacterium]